MQYTSLSDYLKSEYGEKLYKLSLSSGCTCPNRDGFLASGGCIFCSAGGSGEFAAPSALPVAEQIEAAKERIRGKAHADKYIAYFQSYTNTYGDVGRLRALYTDAISHPDVAILSIATRPDCLSDEILKMLSDLNDIKPVWVELGLQTSKPESVSYIRRGYENAVYEKAVAALNALGIKVITHIIIGLPGESYEDMESSVLYACKCGTWGLKLQLLHVLKNTDLAADYESGLFETMSMDEYIDVICRLLAKIPKDVVIHRLTGDGPKNLLMAPIWSGNKKAVLNKLLNEIRKRDELN